MPRKPSRRSWKSASPTSQGPPNRQRPHRDEYKILVIVPGSTRQRGFGIRETNMPGIHHVTAIAGDPLRNLDFYTRDLGLRFVKKTVNFDDPSTYHFYYGDESGNPGTILTFFPWTNAPAGQRGTGETRQTVFRVPLRSIGYWTQRFIDKGIPHQALETRFGQ